MLNPAGIQIANRNGKRKVKPLNDITVGQIDSSSSEAPYHGKALEAGGLNNVTADTHKLGTV